MEQMFLMKNNSAQVKILCDVKIKKHLIDEIFKQDHKMPPAILSGGAIADKIF